MDQYLFVETLPSKTSQSPKLRQQAKARSHAATIAHRRSMLKRNPLNDAQRPPQSHNQPRSTRTAVYREGPAPQYLRSHVTQKSGDEPNLENDNTELPPESFEVTQQLAKRYVAGPQTLLDASRRDPFRTHPVSKPAIRFDELFDFGKTERIHKVDLSI
jgi:hypothetical protein